MSLFTVSSSSYSSSNLCLKIKTKANFNVACRVDVYGETESLVIVMHLLIVLFSVFSSSSSR